MSDKVVQIKLRNSVSVESKIMSLLEQSGPRSGLPKQLLIAGYKALYESAGEAGSSSSEAHNDEQTKTDEKKPHAFGSFVVKG